ncbi:MAG: restriction endonuclease subunit S, partial [Bacteroides sp.]|nr:restriction endonuclease subunit S [Bacteroides sp.]
MYRGEDNSYYEKILASGEVRCIDDEIPFEIPDSWAWCRLGIISTYSQTKKKINASKADPMLWGLDLEDIEKGGRLLKTRTVGERKAIGDKTIFRSGDILYSKLRPYLLKILIALEDGICTPEIIPFTCYGDINKYYIVDFLKSPYVNDYINSVTFGVKMPRVSTYTMTSLLVPLPPLYEQERIEIKLSKLTPLIERFNMANEYLNTLDKELSDSLLKGILQEAIQGKLVPQLTSEGTAEELLEEIRAEKKRLIKEGKLKASAIKVESRIFRGEDNK